MDSIDLFVDHFVIHSESREALVLNAGSSAEFERHLRNLVSHEIRDALSKEINAFEEEITKSNGVRKQRLIDGSNALRGLRSDLVWAKVREGVSA